MCTETSAAWLSSVPGVCFPSLASSDPEGGRDGGPHSHAGSHENEHSGDLSAFCVSPQKQPSLGEYFLRKALCKAYTYYSNVNSFCCSHLDGHVRKAPQLVALLRSAHTSVSLSPLL